MTKEDNSFLCQKCSRRQFLKNTFAAVTVVSIINPLTWSCSSTDLNSLSTDNGISYDAENNLLLIDTTGTDGQSLASNNDLLLINGTVDGVGINVMTVRVNDTVYAYNSTCPHAGVNSQWSYSSETLTCGAHGNWWSYDNTSQRNATLSALTSYDVTEDADIVSIQL